MKRLEFARGTWPSLMEDVRRRGAGVRESGAFLLGHMNEEARVVEKWVAYEDLDPLALNFEYVRLETEAFSRLWQYCEAVGLEVVGDLHTHPFGPRQSPSDRANPMISIAGHVALIVPRFAQGDVRPHDLSLNIYQGNKRWLNQFGAQAAEQIRIAE